MEIPVNGSGLTLTGRTTGRAPPTTYEVKVGEVQRALSGWRKDPEAATGAMKTTLRKPRPACREPPQAKERIGDINRAAHLILALYLLALALAVTAKTTRATPDALMRGFMCIHRFEGSWTDPGAPYYGGLQMDWSFMSTYGSDYLRAWGTADHWPPAVQIAVAMRAYLSGRGFYPWPNSARLCGLI
jgi:hypothetical protein